MKMQTAVMQLSCWLLMGWAGVASAEAGKRPAQLNTDPVGAGDLLQMVLGLFLVLGLIVAMAWFVRRMGSFQQISHGALRILGGLSLGQRERIVLVQVGDKQLLIGIAPGQIRTLHVLDRPVATMDNRPEKGGSFAERLQSVIQGKIKP